MREREGLIARIRQIRSSSAPREEAGRSPAAASPAAAVEQERIRGLETRVEHLEHMVQGLQDSVHRESSRQERRIAELESRTQPGALGKALDADARARGL